MLAEVSGGVNYPVRCAFRGSATLVTDRSRFGDPEIFQAFQRNGKELLGVPLVTEEEILAGLSTVVIKRILKGGREYARPYWNPELEITGREVFVTCVQFFDRHNEPLPKTTIPPESDVKRFIQEVRSRRCRLGIVEQFKLLLDITNDNVVGAANLGMMATRLMARGMDQRAYPNIKITPNDILGWNNCVRQFETYKGLFSDGPGDNYYFWTHFFASAAFKYIDPELFKHKVLDLAFSKGTQIMRCVRHTISPHMEASCIGRNVGLAIAEMIKPDYPSVDGVKFGDEVVDR